MLNKAFVCAGGTNSSKALGKLTLLVPYTNSAPKFYLSPGAIDDPVAAEKVAVTGGADAFIAVAAGKLGGFVQLFVANVSAGENECSCAV